jgi:hypothetical protein
VLSHLVHLTSLSFASNWYHPAADMWKSQLAPALTALVGLQRLALTCVWPGLVADALGVLTGPMELELTGHQTAGQRQRLPDHPQPAPLHLAGVQLPRLHVVDLPFLASLVAPKLQSVQGCVSYSYRSGTPFLSSVAVAVDDLATEPDWEGVLVARCARGVLKCCNRLTLTTLRLFTHRAPSATLPETSDAMRSALPAWWMAAHLTCSTRTRRMAHLSQGGSLHHLQGHHLQQVHAG